MTRPLALPENQVYSPEAVVDILGKAGVKVSERELRAKARRLGCYREIGRAMFFLPEDLEVVMDSRFRSREDLLRWLYADDEERLHEKLALDGHAPDGEVYFIRRHDEIKIGYSTNVESRMRQFRTATTEPIHLVLTIAGTLALERYFHNKFQHLHVAREWFSFRDELRDFILRRTFQK